MRWGFPHPKDWRRPQLIHARNETIDTTRAFAEAFATGQRGIVVFKTFNEGEEVAKPNGKTETVQWTIDPRDGQPRLRLPLAAFRDSRFTATNARVRYGDRVSEQAAS